MLSVPDNNIFSWLLPLRLVEFVKLQKIQFCTTILYCKLEKKNCIVLKLCSNAVLFLFITAYILY